MRKFRKLVVGPSILVDSPESGWLVAIGQGKIFPFRAETFGGDFHTQLCVLRYIGRKSISHLATQLRWMKTLQINNYNKM